MIFYDSSDSQRTVMSERIHRQRFNDQTFIKTRVRVEVISPARVQFVPSALTLPPAASHRDF